MKNRHQQLSADLCVVAGGLDTVKDNETICQELYRIALGVYPRHAGDRLIAAAWLETAETHGLLR
jgi:hypothetical protein